MKLIQSILICSALSVTTFAQDTFKFSGTIAPNSIYIMKMHSDSELIMQIDTPIEIEGLDKKTTTHTTSTFNIQTKSFDQLPNKDVPFEITYNNIDMKLEYNNQVMPHSQDDLKGLYEVKLKGISNDAGRGGLEYVGPDEYKEVFSGILKSVESLTKYPTEVFAIGQSHSIPYTTEIPLENGQHYKMEFNIKYTLNKIENDFAYFDVLLFADQKKQNIDGLILNVDTYQVKGQMKVFVKDNNIYESSFKGPMKMTMQKDAVTIIMDYKYQYNLNSSKL